MRNRGAFFSFIIALATTPMAHAGVKVDKAKRKATESTERASANVAKRCGTRPAVSIDWKGLDSAKEADFKSIRRERHHVIQMFGNQARDVANSLAAVCGDADYKKAVAAGVKKLKLVSSSDLKLKKASFALKGKTITVTVPSTYSPALARLQRSIRALF